MAEEECFYESLDRILSSSSSSTSTSDDDDNCCINSKPIGHNQSHNQTTSSPRSMSKYDVWNSMSLSVEERRSHLLREIGFSSDCSLARRKPPNPSAMAISDRILKDRNPSDGFSMIRSKSDSSSGQLPPRNHRNFSSASSPSILMGEDALETASPVGNTTINERSSSIEASPCKSPENQLCMIRDLDNGKEFVVNEFREDGLLKEVGTGRKMTIEEFERSVGHSPIVQELMRRQNVAGEGKVNVELNATDGGERVVKSKKKSGWLKSIKLVATSMTGRREMRSGDERDSSSEKGGRRSSSATDDGQEVSFHGPERVRVRQYGKSCKELSGLYKTQEIRAHKGSIWSIEFSLDGRYLASAGEDCVIRVWRVVEVEKKGGLVMEKPDDGVANGSPEPTCVSPVADGHLGKKKKSVVAIGRKSPSLDNVVVPENIFAFSEKPVCSFHGHLRDVLDLSWSKSQHLLSSSMDKTVRLWHLSKQSCLKVFSHNDYVTCIQFNPVDDRYFISGSLDAKVRIWSIPDRQVVDWCDLHEMVTAACYTSDGQGAFVGSYKGSCHLYNTAENKLQQKSQIMLQHKKKRSQKKITGFQFAPGSSSKAVITSADSRIRVVNGSDVVHKLKGFRNTNSQIMAAFTANGKHVVCASEDSSVYVWKYEPDSPKLTTVTRSYENFRCQGVTAAIPWPGKCDLSDFPEEPFHSPSNHPPTPVEPGHDPDSLSGPTASPAHATMSSASNGYFYDRISATWPEEELAAAKSGSPQAGVDKSAWGLVIVTAGLRGEIRSFQNFGFPVRA